MPYRIAPARPPKIPDGPDRIGAARKVARRNRRIGVALTLAAAASVSAALVVRRADQARHRAAFELAKLDLEPCLLGPEPFANDRAPGACQLRVRRRQLMAMATPVERRIDEAMSGWPMRCGEASHRMAREAAALDAPDLQQAAHAASTQLGTIKAMNAALDIALCADGEGRARAPRLATSATSFPALSAPLDIDALVAHGPPSHVAHAPEGLEKKSEQARVAELMPAGYSDLVPTGTREQPAYQGDEPPMPPMPAGRDNIVKELAWPGVLHVQTCEGGACRKRIVSRETFDLNDPELRASAPSRFHAVKVGASILAVWRAGTRGGLRMRVAPVERLGKTADIVVYDDLVRDGALQGTTTLEDFRVYGGSREARVFLFTARGTWIVNVDERGAFSLY